MVQCVAFNLFSQNMVVYGLVVDSLSSMPLASVKVSVHNKEGSLIHAITTRGDGSFSINSNRSLVKYILFTGPEYVKKLIHLPPNASNISSYICPVH